MSQPGTLFWLAGYELKIGWREWVALMTAGRRHRARMVAVALVVFAAFMHLLAYKVVGQYAQAAADRPTLVVVTGIILMFWSLLLSQALESVTRAFYARADLDLILTAPVSPRRVFSVRIGKIALSVALFAMLLGSPFINVMAWVGGARWLAAYGVAAAMGIASAALAVAMTIGLFHLIGPKRLRLLSQILAAVIGASFVIGLQVFAILTYGDFSRFSLLQSDWLIERVPGIGSIVWWPARAALGDLTMMTVVAAISAALLGVSIAVFAMRFGDHAAAAASVSFTTGRKPRLRGFRPRSASSVLRRKEWTLLWRDPWLMSQSLMQILYLLPPALLLWRSYHEGSNVFIILVPVLVMAAGQLAGGLAWLSISGEDAPDLVATAPIPAFQVTRAKIESVLGAIAMVFAPLIVAIAIAAPQIALIAALGVLVAAASSTAIQLIFRVQAQRSQFRRRQTSSRIATFAEAFSSIAWAAAAGLLAAGTWIAAVPALIAIAILLGVRLIRPPIH